MRERIFGLLQLSNVNICDLLRILEKETFVTICAHREMVAATGGAPFTGVLEKLMEGRLRITEAKCPQMRWGEWGRAEWGVAGLAPHGRGLPRPQFISGAGIRPKKRETHSKIVDADRKIREMTRKHNEFLRELGLPLLPGVKG